MDTILEVSHLVKNYGSLQAVRDISFTVERGGLFAFLGTNGAGKSTTINILSTLMKPDDGSVLIDGFILGKEDAVIRSKIGVVFQNSVLDHLLTVKENLQVRGSFYHLSTDELEERILYAARITGCSDYLFQRYGMLSGGQKRRADIARALLQKPDLLFLDEPTTGLDPQSRQQIWEAISSMQKKEGLTVFLTTHYMEEAAGADHIVIIDKGRIAAQGTPDALREKYLHDLLRIYHPDEEVLCYLQANQMPFETKNDTCEVQIRKPRQAMNILHLIEAEGHTPVFEMKKGTMDDVFLTVIKEAEKKEMAG